MAQSSPDDKSTVDSSANPPRPPSCDSESGVDPSLDTTGRVTQGETDHEMASSASNEYSIADLAEEFMSQHRKGESPTIEDYADDYPDYADEIREFFPAIVALEGFKHFDKPEGKVSLGSSKPRQLGDFRIVREVGRGGMGVVYEAIQESLNRRVAVKVLPRHSLLEGKELKRFRREAEIAASLHHTNIVPVFGVGENEGFHYYVMQFNDGLGLDEILQHMGSPVADPSHSNDSADEHTITRQLEARSHRQHSIRENVDWDKLETCVTDPKKVAAIGIQAARALHYAHDRGVLHRDIKPGNLLLDNDGVLQVTDFGLAHAVERDNISTTGEIVGTLGYMAPEMLNGETTARSDVYSLGITLYELLTRRSAIDRTNRNGMIQQIKQGAIVGPRKLNPAITHDLETIILKAISAEPKHRYSTADQFADDLQRYLENRPIAARRVSTAERLYRWSRRNPAIASLSGLATLLLALIGVVATMGYRAELDQRKKAEQFSMLATSAVDEVFDRFVPKRVQSASDVALSGYGNIGESSAQPILSRQSADILEGMIEFYEQLAESTGDRHEFLIKTAEAHRKVGKIHQRLGDHEAALSAYKKALGGYRNVIGTSVEKLSYEEILNIASISNEIGQLYRQLGRDDESTTAHQRALATLSNLHSVDKKNAAIRFELARTYYLMARELPLELKQRSPNRGKPSEHFMPPPRYLDSSQPLVSQGNPSPDNGHPPLGAKPPHRRGGPPRHNPDGPPHQRPSEVNNVLEQSNSRDADGRPPSVEGLPRERTPEQRDQLQKAILILEESIADHEDDPEYRYLLALCLHETVPGIFAKTEIDQKTEDRSISILDLLVKDYPNVADYRQALVVVYGRIDIRRESDQTIEDFGDVISQRFLNAISHAQKLVSAHPAIPAYKISLIHLHNKLAHVLDIMSQDDRPTNARHHREAAELSRRTTVRLQQELVDQFPQSTFHRNWLTRFQISLSRILGEKQNYMEAAAILTKPIDQLKLDLMHSSDKGAIYRNLHELEKARGHIYKRDGKNERSKNAFEQANEYRDKLQSMEAGRK